LKFIGSTAHAKAIADLNPVVESVIEQTGLGTPFDVDNPANAFAMRAWLQDAYYGIGRKGLFLGFVKLLLRVPRHASQRKRMLSSQTRRRQ
jgi:hypothetical protein